MAVEREIEVVKASEARQHLSEILNKVHRGNVRILVEKSGIPVAGIVSARDMELLKQAEAQRERDFAIFDEIREAFKDVPDEEIEAEIAKALAEVRAEMRAERLAS